MKKTMTKILALVLTMIMLLSVAAPVFANTAVVKHGDANFDHTKANLDAEGIKYTKISDHAAAYCEDNTYTMYQCDDCKAYFLDDVIPATEKCDWEVTKEATCAAEGVETCKICNYERKIAKTEDHEYEAEFNCGDTLADKTTLVCKICGDEKEGTVENVHVWNITVTKAPACNVPGEATYKCTACGYTKTVAITADAVNAEHNWVLGKGQAMDCSKKQDGIVEGYYCKDCKIPAEAGQKLVVGGKDVVNQNEYKVTPYEHAFVDGQVLSNQTCTTDGQMIVQCSECGYHEIKVDAKLGHKWEREGAEALDFTTMTPTLVACDAETGSVGKYVYKVHCDDCGKDVVVKEVKHELTTGKVVAPTCSAKGYTCDYCELCNVELNIKVDETTAINPDNHVWYTSAEEADAAGKSGAYVVTKKPTCTTEGVATSKCKLCGRAEKDDLTIAPTIHDYYVVENGKIKLDDDGNIMYQGGEYNCTTGKIVYTCTKCNDKEAGHTLKLNVPDYNFDDPAFHNGTLTVVTIEGKTNAGDCKNDKVTVYTCSNHDGYIYHNEGKQHDTNNALYEEKLDPTCDAPGYMGYEQCNNCNYKSGVHSTKGGLIPALGHDWDEETYAEPVEETCTTDGNTGYGVCLREGCGHTFGKKNEADRVIDEIDGHNYVLDDFAVVTCVDYAYAHYFCDRCNDETIEKWEGYRVATGHTLKDERLPTCTLEGIKACDDCDYTESVNRVPHIDMERNEIKCATEDFYCFECCDPIFDEVTGKFTGKYGEDKIPAIESHYYADVKVVGGTSCTGFTYILHVCNECQVEWTEGEMTPNAHEPVLSDNWVEGTEPKDFLTAGLKEIICDKCGEVLGTQECALGVEFSFEFDNALVPGANIVNSGYLAVKVYTNSYKQMIHSVDFSFWADSDLFTLEEVKVEDETSPFYGMFFAGQTSDMVNVYGTVQNDADGNVVDVEWDGANKYLVTLIFKVADDANGEYTWSEITTEFLTANDLVTVNAVDEKVEIGSAFAGYVYEDDYFAATILGPVVKDEETGVEVPFILTIKVLGDVNGDAYSTFGSVVSAVDVNKVRELIANEEYLAEADVDKDGAITVRDFEFLAEYHVGGMTYEELCMLPEIPEEPETTPGCPCCPELQ